MVFWLFPHFAHPFCSSCCLYPKWQYEPGSSCEVKLCSRISDDEVRYTQHKQKAVDTEGATSGINCLSFFSE